MTESDCNYKSLGLQYVEVGSLSGCAKVLAVMQDGCGHLNSVVSDSPCKRFHTLPPLTERSLLGPRSGLAPGSALGLF